MRTITWFFLLFSFAITAQAQTKIEGQVFFDGEEVSDAIVRIQTTQEYAAVTDDKGYFKLDIPEKVETYTISWEHPQFQTETKTFKYMEGQKLQLSFREEANEVLEGIVIDQTRKSIRRFADKMVIDVENMTVLNSGSVFEAINKLPGVLVTANGQVAHNGKLATIFLDGEPTGMSGDQLMNFLKNLPANSVKNIEIIDNPGAKYSATFNGTIINVITKSAKISGISGSIMQQNTFNNRFKNTTSAQLMFKKDRLTWNMNTGYTYHEANTDSKNEFSYNFDNQSVSGSENYNIENRFQSYFLRNNIQYKLSESAQLTLMYNYSHNFSKPENSSRVINTFNEVSSEFDQLARTRSLRNSHEFRMIYHQKLDTLGTELTLTTIGQLNGNRSINKLYAEDQLVSDIGSNSDYLYSLSKLDFEKPIKKINGSLSLGAHYNAIRDRNTGYYNWEQDRNFIPFDFQYDNTAAYVSLSSNIKKMMISAGLRYEDLTYQTFSDVDSLNIHRNYKNFFPTVTLRYPLLSGVYIGGGYSKRMNLPAASAFSPNVSDRNSLLVNNAGNPFLRPEINHNANISLTIFDYIYINYNYTLMPNQNAVFYEVMDNGTLESKYQNLQNATTHSFNAGLPIPYMMFTKGLGHLIENRNSINPDELSFTYLNAGYFKTTYEDTVPERFQRGAAYIFTYSQFYLKNNTRLIVVYYNMFRGVMNLYELNQPSQNLNISLNKKFLENRLIVNLSVDNVLNTDGYDVNVFGSGLQMRNQTWNERRMFKVGLTYNFGSFKNQNNGMIPDAQLPFGRNN